MPLTCAIVPLLSMYVAASGVNACLLEDRYRLGEGLNLCQHHVATWPSV